MRLLIAAVLVVVAMLGLGACSGKSQDYINGYQAGYSNGSTTTSLTYMTQAEAYTFCKPNSDTASLSGFDSDYVTGDLAGCIDGATGHSDRYGN